MYMYVQGGTNLHSSCAHRQELGESDKQNSNTCTGVFSE